MRSRPFALLALISLFAACASQSNDSAPDVVVDQVRSEYAALMNVDAAYVDADARFASLQPSPDELDIVELIMSIEERFGIEISDAQLSEYAGSEELDAFAPELSIRSLAEIVHDLQD